MRMTTISPHMAVATMQLQRMFKELDAIGMMDNTLLVVASDNGGCPAMGGSNYPFRGYKHTLFEGGVRTPALVFSKSESIIPAEVMPVERSWSIILRCMF